MKCGLMPTDERAVPCRPQGDPVAFAHSSCEVFGGLPVLSASHIGAQPHAVLGANSKALHSTLRGLGITPQQSTITTNGRALTDGYVEYANANPDIFTVVSWHDGEFTDEQLDLIFPAQSVLNLDVGPPLSDGHVGGADLYYALGERYGRYPNTAVHFLRPTTDALRTTT